jgi:HD-like signal output (HDOD) protein
MRMPGMDGSALLAEVRKRHPEIIRLVLSGQADREVAIRAVDEAHAYLTKPCDPELLRRTIAGRLALRKLVANDTLKAIITQVKALPSLPPQVEEITTELRSPRPSLERVGAIVERDVAMAAKMLQLVNSDFFGLRQPVSSAADAVALLGIETVRTLVLGMHVFAHFQPATRRFDPAELWTHSVATSHYARAIARVQHADAATETDALAAGLLHDCGKLLLAMALPAQYDDVLTEAAERSLPSWEIEEQAFGCTHGQLGAFLLGLWGLPDRVVRAVAWHHRPAETSRGFGVVTAVHAANAIHHDLGSVRLHADAIDGERPWLDTAYLERLGLGDAYPAWRAECAALMKL